jgi:hypothetical protein
MLSRKDSFLRSSDTYQSRLNSVAEILAQSWNPMTKYLTIMDLFDNFDSVDVPPCMVAHVRRGKSELSPPPVHRGGPAAAAASSDDREDKLARMWDLAEHAILFASAYKEEMEAGTGPFARGSGHSAAATTASTPACSVPTEDAQRASGETDDVPEHPPLKVRRC